MVLGKRRKENVFITFKRAARKPTQSMATGIEARLEEVVGCGDALGAGGCRAILRAAQALRHPTPAAVMGETQVCQEIFIILLPDDGQV